jgi:histone-lysine N-methyltransferase SUV420H
MPIPKKEKRGALTLEKLASYDDVITDALVDKVHHSFR